MYQGPFSKKVMALCAALFLAACEPAPVTYTPDQVTIAAALLEDRVKQDVGKRIADDFIVKGVSRKATTVQMNLQFVNQDIVKLAKENIDIFSRIATASIARDLCAGNRNARDLINSGLRMDIVFLDARQRRLFTSVINRC